MATPSVFSCPHCGSNLSLPAANAGIRGPCPACGFSITAPMVEPADSTKIASAPTASAKRFPTKILRTGLLLVPLAICVFLGIWRWFGHQSPLAPPPPPPTQQAASPTSPVAPANEATPIPLPSIQSEGIANESHQSHSPLPAEPPGPLRVADTPPTPAPAPTPTSLGHVRFPSPDFKETARAFMGASRPEDRLPMLFSSRWSREELAGQLASGQLSRLPSMEYKAVVHASRGNHGNQQFYIAVQIPRVSVESPAREIILHLSDHEGAGFRINADALAFHLENSLPNFLARPTEAPLPAWLFVERGQALDESGPAGGILLSLRYGPFTPVIARAVVEADSPLISSISPRLGWGASPQPVFLHLRHRLQGDAPILHAESPLCFDWVSSPSR